MTPDIIETIRARMAERGVSQTDVARHLGTHAPSVCAWLARRHSPALATLERWLAYLELKITAQEQDNGN